jgi:hypothetical protein
MSHQHLLPLALCLLAVMTISASPTSAHDGSGLRVVKLRCEYAKDPLGIDVAQPRLSWQVQSDARGQRQTAYQVMVASSADLLGREKGDLWDSGRVESDQTTQVPYAGTALTSSQRVYWKVRSWDRDGRPTPWSDAATWTMGILDADEWKGAWICAPAETESLLLRHAFIVRKGLKRAVAHASGLGQYELSFNGAKAGDDLLSPGWTDYNRTILYDTRDVTGLLREGENVVGMTLGNGMYHVVRRNRFAKFTGSFGPLRAILHLRLEYDDGTVDVVGTDESWRVSPGAITYNSIYGGEDYDARLEPAGWDTPGFDDRGWRHAVRVVRPGGHLRGLSAAADPIRAIETRKPVGVRTFPDGTAVYDFGQNASFMPSLRVSGPAGSTVRLIPAEVVHEDGTINRNTMGSASRGLSWWQYTKSTDGQETWFPKFYYVGSRFLEAQFIPPGEDAPPPPPPGQQRQEPPAAKVDPARLPRIESLEMVIVHSSAAPAGVFKTSDETLNRVRDLVRWAQRSNMMSILTDCPHREKLGWLEQDHLNGPSLRYEFDLSRVFAKVVSDMADAQTPEGLIPNIAPEYTHFKGTFRAAAEWGASFIAIPWQQYEFTGDAELLRRHYHGMKRYFAYLEARAKDDVLSEGLGDWYDLGAKKPGGAQLTPPPVTATAMFYRDARLLAEIATVLGEAGDAKHYAERADQIRDSYNRHFFIPETGVWGTGSQSSYAIPLALGIVEPSNRDAALAALVREVENNGCATTCGNVGFRFLLRALAEAGRSDLIYRMVTQDEKPGYAWQLKRGETSLTEAWDANLGSSHNHFMFGQVIEWFYHDLAGIQLDPAGPGFKKIVIHPDPVGELRWVEADYDSAHGKIASRWERGGDRLKLSVAIPANTTATIYVPARGGAGVIEGGSPADGRPGVKFLRNESDRAVFAVESGRYTFESHW